ncbi:coiled-coil domain-containing protein 97 isoform X2 [Rhodnius prolixus]
MVSTEVDLVLKNEILNHISMNNEAHFKNQQIGEPDLTKEEKWQIAETLLDKSFSLFLAKFGQYLLEQHFVFFSNSDDYDVNFYVAELKKKFKKPISQSQIRNRRLEALRRLVEEGDYFSDFEMKRRNPLMYEELVGQYLTDEERIQQECNSYGDRRTFAGFFFDLIERNLVDSRLKSEIEKESNGLKEAGSDDSLSSQSSKNFQWGEGVSQNTQRRRVLKNSRPEEVSANEKLILLNEFRSHVFSNFLVGKDAEFDYRFFNKHYRQRMYIGSEQWMR